MKNGKSQVRSFVLFLSFFLFSFFLLSFLSSFPFFLFFLSFPFFFFFLSLSPHFSLPPSPYYLLKGISSSYVSPLLVPATPGQLTFWDFTSHWTVHYSKPLQVAQLLCSDTPTFLLDSSSLTEESLFLLLLLPGPLHCSLFDISALPSPFNWFPLLNVLC